MGRKGLLFSSRLGCARTLSADFLCGLTKEKSRTGRRLRPNTEVVFGGFLQEFFHLLFAGIFADVCKWQLIRK
jgi:hypothetical protein